MFERQKKLLGVVTHAPESVDFEIKMQVAHAINKRHIHVRQKRRKALCIVL